MVQYKNMVPMDLSKGTAAIINLGTTYQGDANANRVGVYLYDYGKAVTPSGQCAGICRRNDGNEVPLSGTVSGNMVYVTLDGNCYAAQGPITVLVKLVSGSDEITLAAAFGNVETSGGTALIQPVEHLPDYAQLLAEIENMRDATSAANTAATNANGATGYIAPTEASSTASAAHPAGTYFVYNGTLYQATADIASGGSIVTSGSGRNCAAATVGGELAGLNTKLCPDEDVIKTFTADDMESGYWGYSTKYPNTKRLRSKALLPVKKGTVIRYANPTQKVYFGIVETTTSNSLLQSSGWINAGGSGEMVIRFDGYMSYNVEDTDDITTEDYAVTVSLAKIPTRDEINEQVGDVKAKLQAEIAFVSGKTALRFMQKGISAEGVYYGSSTRCATEPFTLENGVYAVESLDPDIQVMIYTDTLLGGAKNGFIFNGVSGSSYAVSVKKNVKIDNVNTDIPITPEYAQKKVYIEKLTLSEPENDPGMNGVTFRSLADEKVYHAKIFNSAVLQTKIWKMPKSGINLQRIRSAALSAETDMAVIGCLFFRLDENGNLEGATDYTYGNTIWSSGQPSVLTTRSSIYYPYDDNLYFAIYYPVAPNLASNTFNAYLAYGNTRNGNGRLTNLAPATIAGGTWPSPNTGKSGPHPTFRQWNYTGYATQQYYYGSIVRLQDAKEICCSAKYSMSCWVYDNSGVSLDVIRGTSLADNKYTGINYIDLSVYGTEGYCFIVIRAPFTAKQPVAVQGQNTTTQLDEITTGGLHLYNDVLNNVFVNYYNHVYIEHGEPLDPKVAHNIELLKRLVVGDTFPFTYRGPVTGGNGNKMDAMKNASPYFYAASARGNQLFLNVSLKSYVTALKNPNSQIYLVGLLDEREEVDKRKQNGYGSTCIGLPPILCGFNWSASGVFIPGSDPANNPDFEYVSRWKYTEEPEALQVGDWLIGLTLKDTETAEQPTNRDMHAVLITGKIHINGELVCYEGLEAYPPYVKYRYIYVSSPLNRFNEEFSRNEPLGSYFTRYARLKDHSKIKTWEDAYGSMSTDFDVGKLMCDRGTDSIYGVGQNHCYITIADANMQAFHLYKDGVLKHTYPLSSEPRVPFTDQNFGPTPYTAVDIIGEIRENGAGYYTLKADDEDAVAESFAVGGVKTVDVTIPSSGDTATVTFADPSDVAYVIVGYYTGSKSAFYTYTDEMIETVGGNGQLTVPKRNTWYTDGEYDLYSVYVLYYVRHDNEILGTYYVSRQGLSSVNPPYYVSSEYDKGVQVAAPTQAEEEEET